MSLDWRRLAATDRLVRQRQLIGRPLFLRPLVLGAIAAVAGAAVLAALPRPDAEVVWLGGLFGAAALIVAGAPWRMFWRADSSFLGRLPIEGKELYRLGAWRSLDAAWPLAAILAISAFGLGAAPLEVARHLAFDGALLIAGAALAPAVGALAGVMVVSGQAQALVQGATGQTAPPTTWLSIVPAAGAAAVIWAGYTATPWLASGAPRALVPLAAALVLAAAILLAVQPLAGRGLASATRAVAALDAVRLAHVDLVGPRGLERLAGRLLPRPARLVYDKDIALARRRHPGYYLVTGLGVIALWIVAFAVGEPTRDLVAVAGAGLLGAYTILFGRRLAVPPGEQPRLIGTLPIAPRAVHAAKRLAVAWRALFTVAVAGAPTAARAAEPWLLAGALAAILVAVTLAGAALARLR